MQRARRLASVAVIASLAVTGLSACRSEPAVAAYLPGDTVTVDEVAAIYDNAESELTKATTAAAAQNGASAPAAPPAKMPITRQDIVDTLVGRAVLTALFKQAGQAVPDQLPLDQGAKAVGLPATATYVRDFTEVQVMVSTLNQAAQPVELTPADLKDVYQKLVASGGVPAELTLQAFTTGLPEQGRSTLSKAYAVRQVVKAQADKLKIRVNPRFQPAQIPVLVDQDAQGRPLTLVSVPLENSDGAVPVTDVG